MEDELELETVSRQNSSLVDRSSRKRGGTTDSNQRCQFHLRRIGQQATKPNVADIMDFDKVTSLIGRNRDQVDFVLDSSNPVASQYISRLHARVVRQGRNAHRLFDDSLNGIFINNTKIQGSVVLREGDIVTFGHPYGMKLAPGVWKRQPDSEYQFIFERCMCLTEPPVKTKKSTVLEDRINIHNTEKEPSPKAKLARVDSQDVDAVLSATRILDSCISKISGLAQSLRESPTACKRSADLMTNVQHDISTTSHQPGTGTCAKTLFPISAQALTAVNKNLPGYASACNDTMVADISVCMKSQDDHQDQSKSSTVDRKTSKSPASGDNGPKRGKSSKDVASGQYIPHSDCEQKQSLVPPQQHALSQSEIDHFISEPPVPSPIHEKGKLIQDKRDLTLTELVNMPVLTVNSDSPQLLNSPSENVVQLYRICASDASDTARTDRSVPVQDVGKSDLQDSQDIKGANQVDHISVKAAGEQSAPAKNSESCQQILLTDLHLAAAVVSVEDENILTENNSDRECELLENSKAAVDLSLDETVTAETASAQQQTMEPQLMSNIIPGDTVSQTDVISNVCNSSERLGGCADTSEDVHVLQEDNLAPPAHTKSHDASNMADQHCQLYVSNSRPDADEVQGQTENNTGISPSIASLPQADDSQCERDTTYIAVPQGESASSPGHHLSGSVLPNLVLISSPSCSKSKFHPSTSDTPQVGCRIETEPSLQPAELSQSHCQIDVTQMEAADGGLKPSSSNVDVCSDVSETVPATKVNCETNSLNISAEVVKGICEDFLEDDSGESSLRCADVQSVLARLTESQPEDEQEGGLSVPTTSDREITHACDVNVANCSYSQQPDAVSDEEDQDDLSLGTLTRQACKADPDSENLAEASKVNSNSDAEKDDGDLAPRSSSPADVVTCAGLSGEQTLPVGSGSQPGVERSVSSRSDVQCSTTTTAVTAHRAENSRVGVSLTPDLQNQQPPYADWLGGPPVGVQKSDHMTDMAKQLTSRTVYIQSNVLHHLESGHEREEEGEEFDEILQTVRSNYACVCGRGEQAEIQERHQIEREEFDTMLQIVRANYACGSEVKWSSEKSLTTSCCGREPETDHPALPIVTSLMSHGSKVSQSGDEISREVEEKLYELGDFDGSSTDTDMVQSLANADQKPLLENGESEIQISSAETGDKQFVGMSCEDVSSETTMSQSANGGRNLENSSVTRTEDGSMELSSCRIYHLQDSLTDVVKDSSSARTIQCDSSPGHSAVEDVTVSPRQDTVTASSLDLFESSAVDGQETEADTGLSGTGQIGESEGSERQLMVTSPAESTMIWSGHNSQQHLRQESERGHQPMLKAETDTGMISQSFITSTPTEEAGEAPAWSLLVGSLVSPVSVQATPTSQGPVVLADSHRDLSTAGVRAVTLTLPVPSVDVSLNGSQTDGETLTEKTEAGISTLIVPQDVLLTDNSMASERNLQPREVVVSQGQCTGVGTENMGRILTNEYRVGKAQQEENSNRCQTACNITASGCVELVIESWAGGDESRCEQEHLPSLSTSVDDVRDAAMNPCDGTSLESGQGTVGGRYGVSTVTDPRECVAPVAAQPRPEIFSDEADMQVTDHEISVDVQKDFEVKNYHESIVSQSEFSKSNDAYNNYGEVQNVVGNGGQVKIIPAGTCADRENEIGGDEKCLMSSEETEALRMWEEQVQSAISRQLNSDVSINTTGGARRESFFAVDKIFCVEKLQNLSVRRDSASATTDCQHVSDIVSSSDSTQVTGEDSSAGDGGRSSHIVLRAMSSSENVDEVPPADHCQESAQAGSQSDVTTVSRDSGRNYSTARVREVGRDKEMAENEIVESCRHEVGKPPIEDDADCELLEPTDNGQLEQMSSTVHWENRQTSEISQANVEDSRSTGENGQAVQEFGQARQENCQARQEDGQVEDKDDQALQEDGQAENKDGQAVQEDGQAVQEDGQAVLEDGQAVLEDGQAVQEDGQADQEDGQAVLEDGQAVQKDGQAVLEDSHAGQEFGQTGQEDGQEEDGQYGHGQENRQGEFLQTFGLCPNLITKCPTPVPVSASSPERGVREDEYLHLNIIARPSGCSPAQKCLLDSRVDVTPGTISYKGPDIPCDRHSDDTEFFKVPSIPQRESPVATTQVDRDGYSQVTLENLSDDQHVSDDVAVRIQNEQNASPDDSGIPKILETFQSTISQSGRVGVKTRPVDLDERSAGENDNAGVEESLMCEGETGDDIQSVTSQLSEFRDEEDLHLVWSQFDTSMDRVSSLGEDVDFNTSFSVPEGDGQGEMVGQGVAAEDIGSGVGGDSLAVTETADSHGSDHMNSQAQTDFADSGGSEHMNSQAATEMADSDVSERDDHMDSQALTDTADSDVNDSVTSQAVTEMSDSDVKEQEKHVDSQDSQALTDTADSDAYEAVDSQALTDIADSDQEEAHSCRTSCTSNQSAAVHRNDGIEFGDSLSDESLTNLSKCEREERSGAQADLSHSGIQHFEEMSGTTDSRAESVEAEKVTTTERFNELNAEESSDIGEKVREGKTTSGHLVATGSVEMPSEGVNSSGDHLTADTSLDVVSVSCMDVIKETAEMMDRQTGQTDGQVSWQGQGKTEDVAALTSQVTGMCSAGHLNLSLGFGSGTSQSDANVLVDSCATEAGSDHPGQAQFTVDLGETGVKIPQSESFKVKVTGDSGDDVSERSDTDSDNHAENTDVSLANDLGRKAVSQAGLVADDSILRVGTSGRIDIGQATDTVFSESSSKPDQHRCVQCVSSDAAASAKVLTSDREAETAETSPVMGNDVSVEPSVTIDSEIWNRQEMSEVTHSDVEPDGEISKDANISVTSDLPSSQGFDVADCSGNMSGSEQETSWCEEAGEPWRAGRSGVSVSQVRTGPGTEAVSPVNTTNVCDKKQMPGPKSDDISTGERSLQSQACSYEGVSEVENVCSEMSDIVMEGPAGCLRDILTGNSCGSLRNWTNHMSSDVYMVKTDGETQSAVCGETQSFVRCEPGVDLVKVRSSDVDEVKSKTEHQDLQNSSKVGHGRDLKRKSKETSENVEKRCRYSSDNSITAEDDIDVTHPSPVGGLPTKKFLHPLRLSERNLTAHEELAAGDQDVTDHSFKIIHLQVDHLCDKKAGKDQNQLPNSVSHENGPCVSTFTENRLTSSQAERHSTQTEKSRTSQERETQPSKNQSRQTPMTEGKLTTVPITNPTILGEASCRSPHTKVLHLLAQPMWRSRHVSTSLHYSSSSPRKPKDTLPAIVISPADEGTSQPLHTPKQSIESDAAMLLNPLCQMSKNFAATAGDSPTLSSSIPPTQAPLSPTHTDLASRTLPASSCPLSGKSVTSSAALSHLSVTQTAASTSQHSSSLANTPDSQRARRREQLQAAVLGELVRLNKEIRISLKIGNPNLEQAIAALEDLNMLPINPAVLEQSPTIVDTVRKCQKYGYCESVRTIARRIYSRFQAVLGSDTEK